jgi:hypothetical protein
MWCILFPYSCRVGQTGNPQTPTWRRKERMSVPPAQPLTRTRNCPPLWPQRRQSKSLLVGIGKEEEEEEGSSIMARSPLRPLQELHPTPHSSKEPNTTLAPLRSSPHHHQNSWGRVRNQLHQRAGFTSPQSHFQSIAGSDDPLPHHAIAVGEGRRRDFAHCSWWVGPVWQSSMCPLRRRIQALQMSLMREHHFTLLTSAPHNNNNNRYKWEEEEVLFCNLQQETSTPASNNNAPTSAWLLWLMASPPPLQTWSSPSTPHSQKQSSLAPPPQLTHTSTLSSSTPPSTPLHPLSEGVKRADLAVGEGVCLSWTWSLPSWTQPTTQISLQRTNVILSFLP